MLQRIPNKQNILWRPYGLSKGEGLRKAATLSSCWRGFVNYFSIAGYLKVKKGQITFNSEGNDNKKSKYFSRKAHVPSKWSGVTIGRGYDMKYKSQKQIITDLTNAGVSRSVATEFAKGAGLHGTKAREFLKVTSLMRNFIPNRTSIYYHIK